MSTISTLPNVSKYLDNDSYLKKYYGDRIYDVINKVYDMLKHDTELVSWLGCKLNSYMDLYVEFTNKLDALDYTDLSTEDGLEMYNIMNEKAFYHVWVTDLLDYMINKINNN